MRMDPPGVHEYFLEHAGLEQLSRTPAVAIQEMKLVDARISISALAHLEGMAAVDPKRQAAYARGRDELKQIVMRKRRVLTQYPTRAHAEAAGMTLEAYEEFAAKAMFLDREEPSAAWVELGRRQQGLADYMANVRSIRIEADRTDLVLNVEGRTWINSDGRRNMPSGEIFTGPVENSAKGKIYSGFPTQRDGRVVQAIELEFDQGKVVRANAENGEDYLLAMLETDGGSRFLGELGIGLNQGIQTFTGSILYDEKIGGTIHLALGDSYPETGGVNRSALHWDLILDTRTQGRVYADGALVMENGKWLVG